MKENFSDSLSDSLSEKDDKNRASTKPSNSSDSKADSTNQEVESDQFNTKKIIEDTTRYGDWVIKGQAIDF